MSLLFRSENEDTARKVHARWQEVSKARERSASGSTSKFDSLSFMRSPASTYSDEATPQADRPTSEDGVGSMKPETREPQLSINSCRFQPSINDRALAFFDATYILSNNMLPPQVDNDCLLDMAAMTARGPLSLPNEIENQLLASITAVGLAGFAAKFHSAKLALVAREKYISAIKLINEALRSPKHCKADSTLQAILFLGLFENVAGTSKRSFQAWVNHMNGAASLLKLRGHQQFSTPQSRALFLRAVSCLLIACSAKGTALPTYVEDLHEQYGKIVENPDGLPWRYHQEFLKFGKLRADCEAGILKGNDLIARALEIDDNFDSIFIEAPSHFWYTTVYTEPDPEIFFLGYYHMYSNLLAVNFWNAMRLKRLILNQLVLKTIRSILTDAFSLQIHVTYEEQIRRSIQNMRKLQSDIVASVPQHLGSGLKSGRLLRSTSETIVPVKVRSFTLKTTENLIGSSVKDPAGHEAIFSGSTSPRSGQIQEVIPSSYMDRPGCGQYILWPLYIAGCASVTTDASREYIIRTLRCIGREMGLMHAFELADSLETRDLEDCSDFLR